MSLLPYYKTNSQLHSFADIYFCAPVCKTVDFLLKLTLIVYSRANGDGDVVLICHNRDNSAIQLPFFFFAVEVGVEDIDDLLKITLLIQGHAVQMCIRA